jgi:hypothetical protein
MARVTSNESSFATAVLAELSQRTGQTYPVTPQNIQWIEQWVSREGGGGANNPLNTTQDTPTATVLAGNKSGVKNYSSLDEGVGATVTTLVNGDYTHILSALQSGNALQADQQGLLSKDLLTWSGGGYSTVANVKATPVGSIGGTNSAGASTANEDTAGSGVSIDGFLQSQAPELAKALGADPQVTSLLQAWGNNTISDGEFQDQLEQTNWWKTTSQTQRSLLVEKATDPGTFANDQANETPTDTNAIKALYQDYAIPVTDQKLNTTLASVLSGATTMQAVQSGIVQQAKTLYSTNPQLASYIDDSHSVRDWADPYLSSAATLLGLNENNIDLNAPMWSKVLNPATNPSTGQPGDQAMTLDQWNTTLRTDPTYGYDTSENALSTASSFANDLVSKLTGAGF